MEDILHQILVFVEPDAQDSHSVLPPLQSYRAIIDYQSLHWILNLYKLVNAVCIWYLPHIPYYIPLQDIFAITIVNISHCAGRLILSQYLYIVPRVISPFGKTCYTNW